MRRVKPKIRTTKAVKKKIHAARKPRDPDQVLSQLGSSLMCIAIGLAGIGHVLMNAPAPKKLKKDPDPVSDNAESGRIMDEFWRDP